MFTWDKNTRSIVAKAREGFCDVGYLVADIGKIKGLKLGFDGEFNPVCFLAARGGLDDHRPGYLNLNRN